MPYQNERFESFLKKEIASFLLRWPPTDSGVFVSVVDSVADSFSDTAKIYISIFPKNASGKAIKDLRGVSREVRRCLAERLKRRKIPNILFELANTEQTERLEKILEKVKNE